MFVYNLAESIDSSISSVLAAAKGLDFQLYVMCNGCRDKSYEVAIKSSQVDKRVKVYNLSIADKAATWNSFVYDYYDKISLRVFLDGDLTFEENAIINIAEYQYHHSEYNSVSGLPWAGGRESAMRRSLLLQRHEISGNLYTLSTRFLRKLITRNVKLPVGLIGDDSMLGYLAATDIESGTDEPIMRRGVCRGAIFVYERLSVFRIKHFKLYVRRKVRYAMRKLQQDAVVSKIKSRGLEAIPTNANDAFKGELAKLKFQGIDTIFTFFAIKQIKRHLNE